MLWKNMTYTEGFSVTRNIFGNLSSVFMLWSCELPAWAIGFRSHHVFQCSREPLFYDYPWDPNLVTSKASRLCLSACLCTYQSTVAHKQESVAFSFSSLILFNLTAVIVSSLMYVIV